MIGGVVHLNLVPDSEKNDRTVALELYAVPNGSKVILFVGDRIMVSKYLIDQAGQFVDHVHLEVQGSVRAVEAWVAALRREAGPWAVSA